MQKDVFTPSNTNSNKQDVQKDSNFFLQPQQLVIPSKNTDNSRSLNGYDMNLLEENAYKDINDESFKIEYKISKVENEIIEIKNKILAADEIGDIQTSEKLNIQKKQLEENLYELNEIYKEISLSAKISDSVTSLFSIRDFKLSNIYNRIVSVLPSKISSLITLKQSLEKLENINKNVDELVSMQIPYGEAANKYSQLSKYIVKANSIQSEISKHIK